MRVLYFAVAAYVLVSAVACQPLREAADIQLHQPRSTTGAGSEPVRVVKRRVEALSAAREMMSNFFFRLGRRVPEAGKPATEAAGLASDHPLKERLTGVAKARGDTGPGLHDEPPLSDSLGSGRRPHEFRFRGEETGYRADAELAAARLRLYDRPPVTQSHTGEITEVHTEPGPAAAREKVLEADEAQGFSRRKMIVAAGISLTASLALTLTIKNNIDRANENNAQIAAANEQSQASMALLTQSDANQAAPPSRRFEKRHTLPSEARGVGVEKRGAHVVVGALAVTLATMLIWKALRDLGSSGVLQQMDAAKHRRLQHPVGSEGTRADEASRRASQDAPRHHWTKDDSAPQLESDPTLHVSAQLISILPKRLVLLSQTLVRA